MNEICAIPSDVDAARTLQCIRCGQLLDASKAVWLELSATNGRYYTEGKIPLGHVSQGGFQFGADCAAKVLKNGGKCKRVMYAK